MSIVGLRDAVQELRELGLGGTLFRAGWELRARLPFRATEADGDQQAIAALSGGDWIGRLPFAEHQTALAAAVRADISIESLESLRRTADEATRGRVPCFGRWTADFGSPIRWHDDPLTGRRRNGQAWWRVTLADQNAGDVKTSWEVARFPHAYHLARAAAFFPPEAERYAAALASQIRHFLVENPQGRGIHWASGQEISVRLLSWLFASRLLLSVPEGRDVLPLIGSALLAGAAHIEKHIDYARKAVYNNHLLSEALALFAVGVLLPETPQADRWRRVGREVLDQEASRQFYRDGGYIQQSHNYHRVALQDYLWACLFARVDGAGPSAGWLDALDRSLDFLQAEQNPVDGRLPNYGANDGALPSVLSTCDFSDMRPTLQATSLLVRQERAYERGPWDEEAAWWLGVDALDRPVRRPSYRSRSFVESGYHVLRGADPSSFGAFRCGTLRDRFSQIDMLHLDVWWRGLNVLVDPGSYRYNAAPDWHNHFTRTGSHNAVLVDERDQMLHYRPFKVLYWTKARLLRFDDQADLALCEGEHDGYRRHPGACVHRRTILYLKDDLWVVVDRVAGTGRHRARLHWLGGDFPWHPTPASNGMELDTRRGPFAIHVYARDGSPLVGDVRAGVEVPPRGWLSRYYGEKVAVPSLVIEQQGAAPLTFVSVLSGTSCALAVSGDSWQVSVAGAQLHFAVGDDRVEAIRAGT